MSAVSVRDEREEGENDDYEVVMIKIASRFCHSGCWCHRCHRWKTTMSAALLTLLMASFGDSSSRSHSYLRAATPCSSLQLNHSQ